MGCAEDSIITKLYLAAQSENVYVSFLLAFQTSLYRQKYLGLTSQRSQTPGWMIFLIGETLQSAASTLRPTRHFVLILTLTNNAHHAI